LAIAAYCAPIQYGFDATAHTASGLGLGTPDRLHALEHKAGINGADRQVADEGEGIVPQRIEELRRVLRVPPFRFVLRVVGAGSLFEAHSLSGSESTLGLLLLAILDRIDAIKLQLALRFAGTLAGFPQADKAQRTKAKHALLAVVLVAQDPGGRA